MKITPLKILTHAGSWFPLAWLAWDYANNNLTVNPIQDITQRTGKYALVLLVLSLACTPLHTVFGFRQVLNQRRALGLYAFGYAVLHFLSFTWLDYNLDWSLLQEAIFEKPFVFVGLIALLILAALAATSFKSSMKRLGKKWKRLHQLVYVAGILVIVHFSWAVKGDVLRLQGDIGQPVAFGLAVALLLVARFPAVRRWITRLRAGGVWPRRQAARHGREAAAGQRNPTPRRAE